MRDLFYATPARLKFLKTDRAEVGQVKDMIEKLAMAHPSVAFSFVSDGRNLLKFAISPDRISRLREVMGRDFAENALPLSHTREEATLTGFAALPTFNRGTSSEQYLFVGGRPVRDRLLLGAVKGAYQDVLAHDRHPVVALFVDLPSSDVDVNVHPAKAEVRFRDSQNIRGLIVGAIKNALAGAGFRASNTVGSEALQRFSGASNTNYNYQYQPQSFFGQQSSFVNLHEPLGRSCEPLFTPEITTQPLQKPEENNFPLGMARCQLHKTYIVAETESGLVIVDQHAAHERLVLEKMKTALSETGIARQKLLIPEVVQLDEEVAEAILARADELLELGFAVESFGNGSIVVRETPAMLGEVDVQGLVKELADNISEYGETLALRAKIEELSGTIACHGSVRAGRSLNINEMNAILREMEKTPNSGQCNHGRPTYIELKRKDVETLFGRRG